MRSSRSAAPTCTCSRRCRRGAISVQPTAPAHAGDFDFDPAVRLQAPDQRRSLAVAVAVSGLGGRRAFIRGDRLDLAGIDTPSAHAMLPMRSMWTSAAMLRLTLAASHRHSDRHSDRVDNPERSSSRFPGGPAGLARVQAPPSRPPSLPTLKELPPVIQAAAGRVHANTMRLQRNHRASGRGARHPEAGSTCRLEPSPSYGLRVLDRRASRPCQPQSTAQHW